MNNNGINYWSELEFALREGDEDGIHKWASLLESRNKEPFAEGFTLMEKRLMKFTVKDGYRWLFTAKVIKENGTWIGRVTGK